MTKYSEGNWEVHGTSVLAGGIRISQSGYRGAASVQAEQNFEGVRKANAKLIGASPKMLEALKRVRQDLIYEFGARIYNVNFSYIDEAIKEAE